MKLYSQHCQEEGRETSDSSLVFLGALILGRGWELDHSDHETVIIPLQIINSNLVWYVATPVHYQDPNTLGSLSQADLALKHGGPAEGYLTELSGK